VFSAKEFDMGDTGPKNKGKSGKQKKANKK
jgi:hypothetical protein